jgi:hypothetical protein
VTRERLVNLALEIGWMVPWLFFLRAGQAWWVVPAAGLASLAVLQSGRRAMWGPVSLAAALGVGALTGGVAAAVAGGLAWWRGWAQQGEGRPRLLVRLMVVLVTLAVLVLLRPAWWWILAFALVLTAGGLAESARPGGVSGGEWWALAVGLTVVALGGALVLYGLTAWGPWQVLFGLLIALFKAAVKAVAFLFFSLLGHLRLAGHYFRPKITHAKHATTRPPPVKYAGGHDLLLVVLLTLAGVAAVGLGAWWLSRALASWQPAASEAEDRVERRKIAGRADRRAPSLSYTRRFVAWRMRRSRRRRQGPAIHETVREWLLRLHGRVPETAVRLYEEVRYRGASDSAARADEARRQWPAEPPSRR